MEIVYYYVVLAILCVHLQNNSKKDIFDNVDKTSKDGTSEVSTDLLEMLKNFFMLPHIDQHAFKIFYSCGFFFSLNMMRHFGAVGLNFFFDYKKIFFKNGIFEGPDYQTHLLYENRPGYIASIKKISKDKGKCPDNFILELMEKGSVIGKNYEFDFWFQRNLATNKFKNSITFRAYDNDKDLLNHLMSCLNDIAKRLSVHINSYIDNYNHFLSNSEAYIDKDLENFIENIDTIHGSYYLFDEYLEDKSFSKAVENLDMKLNYSCIEETRKIIKNKRKSHLPPDLIEKLLAANKELMILYNAVQRQHDAHKNKVAKQFFKDNPHIFKILQYDDIKGLEFSSDPNGIRNARRKLCTDIAERAGKTVSGSKIAKEVALE